MKVLFGVSYFFPDNFGGTEMYVLDLAKALITIGVECAVIAPIIDQENQEYEFEGVPVFRFHTKSYLSRDEVSGKAAVHNLGAFKAILTAFSPDIYHQHSLTTSLGVDHLLWAKRREYKTIFTSHLPGTTCIRGDLMYLGTKICSGEMLPSKCTKCKLHQLEKSEIIQSIGYLTASLSKWKLLRGILPNISSLVTRKKEKLKFIMEHINQFIVTSYWQKQVFALNGYDEQRIMVIKQSVPKALIVKRPYRNESKNKIKIGFLGRIDPMKGLHKVIQAILKTPNLESIELEIVGTYHKRTENYYNVQREISKKDYRIKWKGRLDGESKWNWIKTLDFMIIPSVCLETGPIVALEALALGVPVIGSSLGGIKETIKHGENGFLYDPFDEDALVVLLNQLRDNPNLRNKLSENIEGINTTEKQAIETLNVYEKVIRQPVA